MAAWHERPQASEFVDHASLFFGVDLAKVDHRLPDGPHLRRRHLLQHQVGGRSLEAGDETAALRIPLV